MLSLSLALSFPLPFSLHPPSPSPLQSILNSDETSHDLENLDPDTLYDVTVTAIYPDESESEDLIGSQRTCRFTLLFFSSLILLSVTFMFYI